MKQIDAATVLDTAASLVTDDDSNPEYDRAIVELTSYLLGIDTDARDTTLDILRALAH